MDWVPLGEEITREHLDGAVSHVTFEPGDALLVDAGRSAAEWIADNRVFGPGLGLRCVDGRSRRASRAQLGGAVVHLAQRAIAGGTGSLVNPLLIL